MRETAPSPQGFRESVKIDQNHSTDKVQNLANERRQIYKDPRQDLGRRNKSYTRYPMKCFTQIYKALYGDAMLELIRMSSNMARKPTETSVTEFCYKRVGLDFITLSLVSLKNFRPLSVVGKSRLMIKKEVTY